MADAWSDDRLELVLASVGHHLVVPTVEVAAVAPTASVVPVRPPSRLKVMVAAAAAVVVLVLAGTTLSPVREAIADVVEWLDIGSTRIERVDSRTADPSGLAPVTDGLAAVTPAEAEQALGRPLPATAALGLGPPARIATPPEGGALLSWPDGTTLWLLPASDPDDPLIEKLVGDSVAVVPLPALGDGGVIVSGDHVLTTPHRRAAAESVVLWNDDGLQFRLESDRSPEVMLGMARTLTPAR